MAAYNCQICGNEVDSKDQSSDLKRINCTNFKICNDCLISNAEDDFAEVKKIIAAYTYPLIKV